MSTGTDARLTDEQLQALASLDPEEIRALGDANKWTRRGVLGMLGGGAAAAGGLAYGAGSATAQPTGDEGQIGRQSDRVEAWVSEMDANSVDTTDVNNEFTLDPEDSNFQSDLNSAAENNVRRTQVYLPSGGTGSTSNMSPPYTIPEGVELHLNGYRFAVDTDTDVFTMEGGTRIYGYGVFSTHLVNYTSTVVTIDASSYGNIRLHTGTMAEILGWPLFQGDPGEGEAVRFISGPNNIYFNRYQILTRGYENPIYADIDTASNSNEFAIIAKNWSDAAMKKVGSGPWTEKVHGSLQPDSGSNSYFDLGGSGGGRVNFEGYLWDPQRIADAFTNGEVKASLYHRASPTDYQNSSGEIPLGTTINGVSRRNLGGSGPDATEWDVGSVIFDRDNPGDLYYVFDNRNSNHFTQIGTG